MLPHDDDIQAEMLRLLAGAPGGRMYCQDVYTTLEDRFPQLTDDEVKIPYKNSLSHWANRVQQARRHMVTRGWLKPMLLSGRGYWEISDKGRRVLADQETHAKAHLAKLLGAAPQHQAPRGFPQGAPWCAPYSSKLEML
jgi:hypothetical protein